MGKELIRILIADDHPVFRFGMRALLEAQADIVVVSEAESGLDTVRLASTLQPDLVLMDINMPGINGIEATQQITKDFSDIAVLIITMFDDATVFAAMRAGARGYLLKGATGEETLRAIRGVANGEVIFSPGVAEQMLEYFSRGMKTEPDAPFPELTPRENEILNLLAKGLTNSAIAEELVLSSKTIRNHVSNIFSKLQVATRSEAIIKARQAGLGKQTT
ncbi:MAG: response regulator transcription factor [Anaerolineales bacterium]|jgi:DNA-binding NarL/FixJ family response regulator